MAKQHTARRGSGAAATKNQPGNQTPDTPDINESEIARLKVDQLRDRLRRRGVTGTADMRKPELVDALVQALREGRKTTRSRGGSGSGRDRASSASGPGRRGTGGRSGAGSAPRRRGNGGEQPGNQTPNTPEVNESEIARLKVDQLRDRLRRRGVTGTADMRKPELVDALVQALREGRKTTGSRGGSSPRDGSGSRGSRSGSRRDTPTGAAPDATELAELEQRAADLADVAPQAPEVEEVERRAAELEAPGTEATELPALPAASATAAPKPRAEADGGTVPRQRSGGADTGGRQPVRVADGSRSGPTLSMDTADRVVASMVPPEVDAVDEVVTPEGTMITGGSGPAAESVDTPPLPATGRD
ncbi:hypothetical protein GCM10010169_31890 [Micromonospora fulviviridis]|uniref:hypothetical protein n=1 Tax=Micromonospora fulviviridis TaxID=47860 RepID=UPI001663E0CC|nr:hypothetical protein [Micromonospora fulviviridis]GGR85197.1 hypothetical protein GCM10010169_31890 [Micromonospora fulviviridis]